MFQEIGPERGGHGGNSVGWQSLLDLHGCCTPHLDDIDWVRRTMLEAANRAKATVVGQHFHRFEPHGISGVVVIGESHLAVHIWPEREFAAVDVFTCNSRLNVRAATDWLVEAFAAREPRLVNFGRGSGPAAASDSGPRDDLYIDHDDENGGHWFVGSRSVASLRTPYQAAEIVEFVHFGRALLLDGKLQSTARDEYIYHEALVQPAMCLHPRPRRVLIIGGGEGATAREALRHAAVEEVSMVDIDRELVALAREKLQTWHQDSFDDPRLRLCFGDGYDYIAGTAERFDVIIIDLVDSFEGGPAESLYSAEFYRILKTRLADGGVLVVQAMEFDASEWEDHRRVRDNLRGLFAHTRSYLTFVPSFWSTWGFVMASDAIDPCAVPAAAIDAAIAERKLATQLRFYDGATHQGLFALPKDLRGLLGTR
ncbi:MAG TPA: adenosylmethionine decarboxylase [Rhizomicrobium sp.]